MRPRDVRLVQQSRKGGSPRWWPRAEILRRVPTARLLLEYQGLDDEGLRRRYLERFAAHGVDPGRVELEGWSPNAAMLATYGQVDLALDPFPYSGGITTREALWMGVPVVTCPGETFAGRHSLSHLSNAGLTETIASDAARYVEIAAGLAHDLSRLAGLRAGLRARMASSPLCDGDRLARNLSGPSAPRGGNGVMMRHGERVHAMVTGQSRGGPVAWKSAGSATSSRREVGENRTGVAYDDRGVDGFGPAAVARRTAV